MTKVEFHKYLNQWKSKPSKINKVTEYISQKLEGCSAVGIFIPDKLTDRQWRQLHEHFDCKRSFMGYIEFKRIKH